MSLNEDFAAKARGLYEKFDADGRFADCKPLGSGLINDTFLITTGGDAPDWVLQRVNTAIFTRPDILEANIDAVCEAMDAELTLKGFGGKEKQRRRMTFARSKADGSMYVVTPEGEHWRLSMFIPGSKTLQEVTPETAFEAGKAFGEFQAVATPKALYVGDPLLDVYKESIPDFHNMSFRMQQFREAVAADPKGRLEGVKPLVEAIEARAAEMCSADEMFTQGELPKRICHCDTKVNNMLFDARTGEVLCVIDLDTIMPSFVLSDYGDFLRTGAATVPEDHPFVKEIGFNMDIFKAFTRGYLESAGKFLTPEEKAMLPFGVALFPFMQCVRFLTDWLNGDTYYKIQYPEHNLVRSNAQWRLFEITDALRPDFKAFIEQL